MVTIINRKAKVRLLAGTAAALLLVASAPAQVRAQAGPSPRDFSLPDFGIPGQDRAGWLGVSISDVTVDQAKEMKLPAVRGAVVDEVSENSPAAKAGLIKGDVITEYNGQRVEGALEFERLVRETPPGHTAQMAVWRNGRSQTVSAEVGSASAQLGNGSRNMFRFRGDEPGNFSFRAPRPGAPDGVFNFGAREDTPVLGISAQDLSGQLGSYFGAPDGEGVLVTQVRASSAGEKAGLKAGDVITKVDGQRVRNLGELRQQLRAKRDAKSVMLGIVRKGTETSLAVEPEKRQSPSSRDESRRIPL